MALAALGEAALGTAALVALGPQEIALFVLTCALATGALTGVLARLLRPRDAGGGGGGDRVSPHLPEPPWWPGFERDFRRHAQQRDRAPV